MGLFRIESMPWYDTYEQCYYNTLSINGVPNGNLAQHVIRKNKPKLSPFQTWSNNCCKEDRCPYLIYKTPQDQRPICEDEYDWLMGFLVENNYTIDYEMTKLMMKRTGSNNTQRQRLLCFFRD